ncbi:hypothetical protein [Virgifigura deserti]|uniref:hypothetical protein n=1 Tax=Virgifigura deserti TaxID=2268457 RepID=UPI003CCC2DDA
MPTEAAEEVVRERVVVGSHAIGLGGGAQRADMVTRLAALDARKDTAFSTDIDA